MQSRAGPPAHVPFAQVSPVVHAFASSQAALLLVFTQPVAGLQESLVQRLPSLQSGAAPLTHVPASQVSPTVHAFPSSHGETLSTWTQPVAASQESSVQALPSSQSSGTPHVPDTQSGPIVHALPSSHGSALLM